MIRADHRLEKYPLWVEKGIEAGWIHRYELELLDFIEREYGKLEAEELTAILALSLFVNHGHTRLPLKMSAAEWFKHLDIEGRLNGLVESVREEVIVKHNAIGYDKEDTPFLIINDFLYMRNLYKKECMVAQRLKKTTSSKFQPVDTEELSNLEMLQANSAGPDWQHAASLLAVSNKLLIISGGPGTGKTTTVAKIIQLLTGILKKPLRIALAAPTGKAAARMNESLLKQLSGRSDVSGLYGNSAFPVQAQTLHRLLWRVDKNGMLPPPFEKKLPYDLIIVDEASMIDLGMMDKLLRYTDHQTRLIFLGDKDQLSSVEEGAVLADICIKQENTFRPETVRFLKKAGLNGSIEEENLAGLQDSVIYLTKTYRFEPDSGIFMLANAVQQQNYENASQILADQEVSDVSLKKFQYNKSEMRDLSDLIEKKIRSLTGLRGNRLLSFWLKEIWLTALRRGPAGSDRLNRFLEDMLVGRRAVQPKNGWYHGRPVIVTRNDYSAGVFNGDFGVCERTEDGNFSILFDTSGEEVKRIPARRLREFEPGYFLTVHKSQGSEFDKVNLLLPLQDTPLLTRELIYTAVTRSRNRFVVWGDEQLFVKGISRKTERFTGLREKIELYE